MTNIPIQIQFVKSLTSAKPSRIVAVKPDESSTFELYVTDKKGAIFPIKDNAGFGGITDITSDGSTIIVTENGTEKNLEIDPAILNLIYSSLQPNDNISELNNDAGYIDIEVDPVFQASEASLFTAGDKANLDNQSGVNTGDETTISIQTKRPLKTVTNKSIEGVGNISIDYSDLTNKPFIPSNTSDLVNNSGFITIDDVPTIDTSNLVPYTGATQDVVLGLNSLDANSINLNAIATPTYKRGSVYFDDVNDCISFMDSISNTSVQVGYEVLIRARNNTGVTIPNGSVVYISGAIGQNSTIALAKADVLQTSNLIGVVTHNVLNNTVGKVCVFGLANDLNLSMFNDGDVLYLSQDIAGGFTTIPPTNYVVQVGVVEHAHHTQGKLLVQPKSPLSNILGNSQKVAPTENAVKLFVENKDLSDFNNASADPFVRESELPIIPPPITIDSTPIDESNNAVSSNGVFDALILKQDILTDINFGTFENSLVTKSTPTDTDLITIVDTADSNKAKKSTFTQIKAFLKTYFDTLYQSILVSGTNIKTINGNNILGSGDLTVSGTSLFSYISDNTYAQTTTNSVYVLLKEYDLNKLIDLKALEYSATFKTTGNNGDLLIRIVDSTNTLIYNVAFSVPNANFLLALNHFNLRIDSTNNKLIYITTGASSDIGLMSSSQLIKVTINPNENYRFQILVRTLGTNPMSVENVLIKMYK